MTTRRHVRAGAPRRQRADAGVCYDATAAVVGAARTEEDQHLRRTLLPVLVLVAALLGPSALDRLPASCRPGGDPGWDGVPGYDRR